MKLRVSVGSSPGQGYSEPILTLSVEGKDYHTQKSAEELAKQINAKLDSLGMYFQYPWNKGY